MAIVNLAKNERINLSKKAPGLSNVMIGLGWDPATAESYRGKTTERRGLFSKMFKGDSSDNTQIPEGLRSTLDLDASAILLSNGKFRGQSDLVYYGNLHHKSKCVQHLGDNLTGDGDGDDEEILINLAELPDAYDKIILVVTIYSAKSKKQSFGLVNNVFIRLIDQSKGNELCRYEDNTIKIQHADATTLIFGELERVNGTWEFHAIGEGNTDGSISETCHRYM